MPIKDLSILSTILLSSIGATNDIIANNIYTIIKPSNIPYIIPPNLSNCFITGSFAISDVINLRNINNILAIMNNAIQVPALTIVIATSLAVLFAIDSFASSAALF